jgi:hypothetical protein
VRGTFNDRQLVELRVSVGAFLASVALSAVHLYFDPLLNPDGVAYLAAAEAWLDQGYAAAATVYPVPLYSVMIASTHAATGLGLLTSAHCLDALLIAVLVVALQHLARAIGASVRVQCIVVALALLLPELNGYRSFLLRDFGYWVFSTLALTCLVRYADAPGITRNIVFFGLCLVASAFRAEAIPMCVVMPAALLFGRARRPRAAAALYVPAAATAAIVGLTSVAWPEAAVGRWIPATIQSAFALAEDVPLHVRMQLDGFGTRVLDPQFHDYAAFGLAGGLVAMIVVHVANAASLPLFAVAAIGVARRACGILDRRRVAILWTAFGIALTGLAAVLVSRGIIQTRYAMPAALLIVVVAAFVLDGWYENAFEPRVRRRARFASILLVLYFVAEDGYGLTNSKQHFVETAQWLVRNTPSDARIFTTDPRLLYLADRHVDWHEAAGTRVGMEGPLAIDGFDYWAIYVPHGGVDPTFTDDLRVRPVARFENKNGNAFVIYQARSPTTDPGRGVR